MKKFDYLYYRVKQVDIVKHFNASKGTISDNKKI